MSYTSSITFTTLLFTIFVLSLCVCLILHLFRAAARYSLVFYSSFSFLVIPSWCVCTLFFLLSFFCVLFSFDSSFTHTHTHRLAWVLKRYRICLIYAAAAAAAALRVERLSRWVCGNAFFYSLSSSHSFVGLNTIFVVFRTQRKIHFECQTCSSRTHTIPKQLFWFEAQFDEEGMCACVWTRELSSFVQQSK